jgi:hypothetical protein
MLLYYQLLSVRSFIVFVRDEIVADKGLNYRKKLDYLFNEQHELFEKWNIDEYSYATVYLSLMEKLNDNAHPFFDSKENFIINENNLKKEELKIIGLLWSAVPLSDTKLFIKKNYGNIIPLITFIQQ